MTNPINKYLSNRRYKSVMETFKKEREMIRQYEEQQAAAKETVEVISAYDIAEALRPVFNYQVFEYRVELPGASEMYRAITETNYIKLAHGISHLEKDEEFLAAMCLIDRCEEFGDYNALLMVFNVFEYVVRLSKGNSETIAFARRYIIELRKYLTAQGLL